MADHPDWCGKACDADRVGGRHRGMAIPVGDADSGILATVWREQWGDGPVRVGLAVGPSPILSWTAEEALRVAAAIQEVAGPLVVERVS